MVDNKETRYRKTALEIYKALLINVESPGRRVDQIDVALDLADEFLKKLDVRLEESRK